jgi:hypothetical protein
LIYAALRRLGQPIPTNDLWIAASCLEHGAAQLTLDGRFRAVLSLQVGTKLEDFLPEGRSGLVRGFERMRSAEQLL